MILCVNSSQVIVIPFSFCCFFIPFWLGISASVVQLILQWTVQSCPFVWHLVAFETHACISVNHFILSIIKIYGYLLASAGVLFIFVTNKSLLDTFTVT